MDDVSCPRYPKHHYFIMPIGSPEPKPKSMFFEVASKQIACALIPSLLPNGGWIEKIMLAAPSNECDLNKSLISSANIAHFAGNVFPPPQRWMP